MNRFAFYNDSLLTPDISSNLANSYNAGVGSIVVVDSQEFSDAGYVVIEELGTASWEIIAIASISGNTLTLSSNTAFAHGFGTRVYYTAYNSVRLYRNTVKTSKGTFIQTKLVNGANLTNKGELITVLEDANNTSGYAFLVLYDSVGDIESLELSNPIAYSVEINTLGYVRDNIFLKLGRQPDEIISYDLILQLANECSQDIREQRKRLSDLNNLEDTLGNVTTGNWEYSLPVDIYSKITNNAIYALRFKGEYELEYIDKLEWNYMTEGFVYTKLSTQIVSGATTIGVTNASIFKSDGGTVYIGGDTVAYTGVTGNTLTGVTGVTQTHLINSWVFSSGVYRGKPQYYTIIDEKIYVYPVVDSLNAGKELLIDYDKEIPAITNFSDELPFPAILYTNYIMAEVLKTDNRGEPTNGYIQAMQKYQTRLSNFYKVNPRTATKRIAPAMYYKTRHKV